MPTVAILYIALGDYIVFWREFYESFEENFLPDADKTYFLFTDDGDALNDKSHDNVHAIYQENLGWPGSSLYRYRIFLSIEEKLKEFDYVFYLNANLKCVRTVGNEILPDKGLIVVRHDLDGLTPKAKYPYERNPRSRAYVPEGEGRFYVAGGINGGRCDAYLRMVHELADCIEEDEKNEITAVWHDESHLNRYIFEADRKDYKALSPLYCYPEGSAYPGDPFIVVLEKVKYMDVDKIKGTVGNSRLVTEKTSARGMLKKMLRRFSETLGKKRIIIEVSGGLGSQLFCYALYKKHLSLGHEAYLDSRKCKEEYVLPLLTKDVKQATYRELRSIFMDDSNLVSRGLKRVLGDSCVLYNERVDGVYDHRAIEKDIAFLRGKWQTERYFADIAEEIRTSVCFPDLDESCAGYEIQIRGCESVSVHVGSLDAGYYQAAIEYIKTKVKHLHFFVFSDDIGACKRQFEGIEDVTFIDGKQQKDYDILHLISLCRHNIIANDAFSWWGAWLNEDPDKIVVAPDCWVEDELTPDIWCSKWIRLGGEYD